MFIFFYLVGTSAINWPIVPVLNDESGAVYEENVSTSRKPTPVPLCAQIPQYLTGYRTQAPTVRS
jgi:hypothetical protein